MHGSGNNTSTHPVKLKLCCRRNKQLAKITDEAHESDCWLELSSHDDLGDGLANEISLTADFQSLSLV